MPGNRAKHARGPPTTSEIFPSKTISRKNRRLALKHPDIMATPGEFQSLLRELFQFDSADLNFGAYHIMKLRCALAI